MVNLLGAIRSGLGVGLGLGLMRVRDASSSSLSLGSLKTFPISAIKKMSSDEVINQIIRAIVQNSSYILKNESEGRPDSAASETRGATVAFVAGSAGEPSPSQGANADAAANAEKSKTRGFVIAVRETNF